MFFKENVLTLLDRLTGRDYDKVFKNRKLGHKLEPPKYELLTQAEVDHVMAEMEAKLKKKLQMPPLLKEREPVTKILSKNPELQGFDNCKYVFINISQGISDRVSIMNHVVTITMARKTNSYCKLLICCFHFLL